MDHDIHGWCASFCGDATSGEKATNGRTVEDHGPWCYGQVHGGYGMGADGSRQGMYLHPISRYLHGTYAHEEALRWSGAQFVGLFLNGNDDTPSVLLPPGDARQLAAELVYVADVLSRIDRPHPRINRG